MDELCFMHTTQQIRLGLLWKYAAIKITHQKLSILFPSHFILYFTHPFYLSIFLISLFKRSEDSWSEHIESHSTGFTSGPGTELGSISRLQVLAWAHVACGRCPICWNFLLIVSPDVSLSHWLPLQPVAFLVPSANCTTLPYVSFKGCSSSCIFYLEDSHFQQVLKDACHGAAVIF